MRLGIDFGTTRTLIAAADRGNYPVISFANEEGGATEHFPSVVADVDGRLVFGFDAVAALQDGMPGLRSFKRMLASPTVNGETPVQVGQVEVSVSELLVGYLSAVRDALLQQSNFPTPKNDAALEAVVAVPAHAHAAQRFLTLDAFRQAGFDVRAVMNEPSAAGFEYTHRQPRSISGRRTKVVVYDLGGGTFDASLVHVLGDHHDVLATAGLNRLGGDDFDEMLAALACEAAGVSRDSLSSAAWARHVDACRDAKERLSPSSRRIVVDGELSATIPVATFYEAVMSLVERSIEVMRPLLQNGDDTAMMEEVAGIYLVGGASGLPLVPRMLKQAFGRRVHRSPYPAASCAIGLAIAADESAGFTMTERFSRSFGVFREGMGGQRLVFDPIIPPDTKLPSQGVAEIRRRYRAAHNVGHFRFVECMALSEDGSPASDIVPFGDVRFPFDVRLQERADLASVPVRREESGTLVEERYRVDPNGLVEVEIADLESGYSRTYGLGVV